MEQFKKAQVIMLPTENKGCIIQNIYSLKLGRSIDLNPKHTDFKKQHLYVISDDEMKQGDWLYCNYSNTVHNDYQMSKMACCKKIIATTDTSLEIESKLDAYYRDGIGMQKTLPQPSQQFIEKYIESYNKSDIITDVLVEYEVYMQRQSNVGTTRYILSKDNKSYDKLNFDRVPTLLGIKVNSKDNTITIKKLKDSWNREEIIIILNKLNNALNIGSSLTLEQWININL